MPWSALATSFRQIRRTYGGTGIVLMTMYRHVRPRFARVRSLVFVLACGSLLCCDSTPAGPADEPLPNGRWTAGNACLSVTDAGCNLIAGCGHGQFSRPTIRANGTFEVDGTYRVEIGPVSIDPAPPAHFSGSIDTSRLIITVVPSSSIPPATYAMTPTTPGECSSLCE